MQEIPHLHRKLKLCGAVIDLASHEYKTDSNANGVLTTRRMNTSTDKKLILVIGATGAQGIAVIDGLLAPCADGSPSPYAIRALTRDPDSQRARSLEKKGVECVRGECVPSPSCDNYC